MSNVKKFRIIKFKSKPILSAKSVSKSFGTRVILRKIDIYLNRGEMLGLLGSNGAGKSTFMNIVLGLLKSDFGDIFLAVNTGLDLNFMILNFFILLILLLLFLQICRQTLKL